MNLKYAETEKRIINDVKLFATLDSNDEFTPHADLTYI